MQFREYKKDLLPTTVNFACSYLKRKTVFQKTKFVLVVLKCLLKVLKSSLLSQ